MSKLAHRHHVIPAVYTVLREGDKVLLLRRYITGYKNGWYTLPSGHVEEDESADIAACREAKEEAGIDIEPRDLWLAFTLHSRSHDPETHERISLFFEVSKWRGEPCNAESHKCGKLLWASIDSLPENTIEEVRTALNCIDSEESFATLGFAGEPSDG